MVGGESEALRRTQSGGAIETARNRTPSYRPRLWSSAIPASTAFKASDVHSGSAEESPDSLAPLRSAGTLATPAVFRLDRVRQARGNETQASKGGDSPPD